MEKDDKKMPDLKLKVCEKQCDHCLFSRNRIVSLAAKKKIIQDCIELDAPFECHLGTQVGEKIVCRGFFERMSTNGIRVAQRMDWISFVDPYQILIEKNPLRALVEPYPKSYEQRKREGKK